MSVLLIVVGVLVAAAGVGMIGYGIPINEFSFGNTLIAAGTTAVVGGIIVVAIGVAVGHLQRLAEMLAARPSEQPSRPPEVFEPPSTARAAHAPNRIPFPPRSKPPAFEVPETIAAPPLCRCACQRALNSNCRSDAAQSGHAGRCSGTIRRPGICGRFAVAGGADGSACATRISCAGTATAGKHHCPTGGRKERGTTGGR